MTIVLYSLNLKIIKNLKKRNVSNKISGYLKDKKSKKIWEKSTINHIWSNHEIFDARNNHLHHKPTTILEKIIYITVRTCYYTFNICTGYNFKDPCPKSVVYRLIILESIAGVPGMVAASVRHFNSLRRLKRDHGWIHTLLEEAENERMHLLVIMREFDAGIFIRISVIAAQLILVSVLTISYIAYPSAVHRFVGYLEETAVSTYSSVIKKMELPGTKLQQAWSNLDAPDIAKCYWNLNKNSKWIDVLQMILADEAHHRDINHTLALLRYDQANPFDICNLTNLQISKQLHQQKEGI